MSQTTNQRTLTSADAVILFKAAGFYDTPIQLEGFQADNAFNFGDATVGESRIGVDGKQSGGWVSHEQQFNVYLEANSASRDAMENLRAWINSNRETPVCEFDISVPSIGKRIVLSGFYITATGLGAQKMLSGTQYTFNCVNNGEESI